LQSTATPQNEALPTASLIESAHSAGRFTVTIVKKERQIKSGKIAAGTAAAAALKLKQSGRHGPELGEVSGNERCTHCWRHQPPLLPSH